MAKTSASKKKTTHAKAPAATAAHQPGQPLRVTITKLITRAAARKTIERIFIKDRTHTDPLDARSVNFIPLPKRRGGQIWTKRPNKVHPPLNAGDSATIKATPQTLRDLNSVRDFVEVGAA
ncbi:MAG TPA: hypothetical protein VGQ99_12415 [Tepidisphaeraceae bacterium]|jgi:hypothetical protein|nr:hypothetical protein [Tepidisphaeraceae bacterium]